MSPFHEIFSGQLVHALGWTIIHSLWQGALIGLVVAVAMVFLQKHTARLRYFVYSSSLFLFAGLAFLTFIGSYYSYVPDNSTEVLVSNNYPVKYTQGMVLSNENISETPAMLALLDEFSAYCRKNMPLIVAVWLMGMIISMMRFLGGYALVRRYRTHRVREVGGQWYGRFRELAGKVKVSRNVRLLESAVVKVPMAIGYLKPVVLVPLGALNGVPAIQMEAILVHELAHIYRRDYLVNMVQSLLEAIFFYHPAVWWLSGNIRIERENICDDIAITITGNTMEFAKALTNIQELNLAAPGLAAGLSGKNNNRLLNRIRRLTHKPKLHSGFAEGFIGAGILLLSLAGLSAAAMITYPVHEPMHGDLTFAPAGIILPEYSTQAEFAALPDTTIKEKQKAEQAAAEQKEAEALEEERSEEDVQRIAEAEAAIEAQREAIEAQVEAIREQVESAMEAYKDAMKDFEVDRGQYEKLTEEAMEKYRQAMQYSKQYHWVANPDIWRSYHAPNICFADSASWNFAFPDSLVWYADSLEGIYFGNHEFVFPEMDELESVFERQLELKELQENLKDLEHLYVPAPVEPYAFHYDRGHYLPAEAGVTSHARGLVTAELYEDDLIEHGREYIVVIDDRQMLINGEKQSRSVYKKYRRLVDSLEEPWKFGDSDEYKIFIGR